MAKKRTRPAQGFLVFGHGGWRPGAGRPKSKRRDKIVLHRRRARVTRRTPAHVTLRVQRDLASLRTKARVQVIRAALVAACSGEGFRIIDWSIQGNHVHLVVEADSTGQLARGMQGLCIRVARGLNRAAGRTGPVFTERYHLRVLSSPREVRNARAYVLNNYRRHAQQRGRHVDRDWVDPCTSWAWFDGWRDLPRWLEAVAAKQRGQPPPVATPRGWMLTTGWRRRGLISVNETPACRV